MTREPSVAGPLEVDLSRRVREARIRAGLTEEEVARRARQYDRLLHAHDIADIESGKRTVQFDDALVLSKVLDLDLPQASVTATGLLVNQVFAESSRTLSLKWDRAIEDLRRSRGTVLDLLTAVLRTSTQYSVEMHDAGDEPDAELVASLQLLREELLLTREGLESVDRALDGALSEAAPAAALPGVQTTARTDAQAATWDEPSLRRIAENEKPATLMLLDMCASRPGEHVTLSEIAAAATLTEQEARVQLARLTVRLRTPRYGFEQKRWPVRIESPAHGPTSYSMDAELAAKWRRLRLRRR